MLMTLGLIGGTKEWLLDKIGFKFAAIEENGETKDHGANQRRIQSKSNFFFYRIMKPYI